MSRNREALDVWLERGILALVLGVLLFGPLAMGGVDAPEYLVMQILTTAALLLWAARMALNPKFRFLWPPISWAVLAFTAYAIARYLMADIEYVARMEMIEVVSCACLFFVVVNNLHRQEMTQIISFSLTLLAAGIACFAVYQFVTHSNQVWSFISPYPGRGTGTYISPNNLAGFLELVLPLTMAYLLVGRIKPVTRILLAYATLAILSGMAVTFSRGGWILLTAAILLLLGILVCHRQYRLPAALLVVVLLALGITAGSHYLSRSMSYIRRVDQTLNNGQLDLDIRQTVWVGAEKMWLDHIWWGVGPAHFDYRFPQYRPELVQVRPERVHNDYLNLLCDWGIAGGIIVLAGMTMFGWGLIKTWKYVRPRNGSSNRYAFFLGAICSLFALSIHSLVDFNLHVPANAAIAVTLLSLLSGNLRFTTDRCWWRVPWASKIVAIAALLLCISYLASQGVKRYDEDLWLQRASQHGLPTSDMEAYLERAFSVEPRNPETAFDLGEAHRVQSFEGGRDYVDEGRLALDWYSRSSQLNRWNGPCYLRYGMTLDWLEETNNSPAYYNRADALDPNSYFVAANTGWHFIQVGDYGAARVWLDRSLRLNSNDNPIARQYLDIAYRKLAENASGKSGGFPGF